MKAKYYLSALILSLGFAALTTTEAAAPDNRIISSSKIDVIVFGLTSGSVEVEIENNGQTYYFSGSGSWGMDNTATKIGSFDMTGDSFTITAKPDNYASRDFEMITSSPTLSVETPRSTTSRVVWNEDDLPHRGGEIVVFFRKN